MAKRAIFEEVREAPVATAPKGGLIDGAKQGSRRAVRIWLMLLFALVVVMIAVGGLTRLTDSGLSITEWRPVTGAMPPVTAEDWAAEFELYRQIPEYQLQNQGMSLAEFKVIYWWEWGHRQLGRVIGLVWALGFFGLLLTRKIPAGWTGRLLALGVLGGLQGAIGWWMVSSGLTGTMLDVASYRLATHLGLAFVILGLITWYVVSMGRSASDLLQARRLADGRMMGWATLVLGVVFLQIVWGAMVAGIDAGRSYTEWPLMGGGFLPPTMWDLQPVWRNLTENAGTVQFIHRVLGYVAFALIVAAAWVAGGAANRRVTLAFHGVAYMAVIQMGLGIMTVIYAAPWHLAILHQFGAVLLLALTVLARHRAKYPVAQSVRS